MLVVGVEDFVDFLEDGFGVVGFWGVVVVVVGEVEDGGYVVVVEGKIYVRYMILWFILRD